MLPDRKEMMAPLLRGMMDGRAYPTNDLIGILKKHFSLSGADLKARRVEYELGWAKTYLTKIGLARYPRRAHLQITRHGRRLVDRNDCPDRITRRCVEALKMEPGLVDGQYLGEL